MTHLIGILLVAVGLIIPHDKVETARKVGHKAVHVEDVSAILQVQSGEAFLDGTAFLGDVQRVRAIGMLANGLAGIKVKDEVLHKELTGQVRIDDDALDWFAGEDCLADGLALVRRKEGKMR